MLALLILSALLGLVWLRGYGHARATLRRGLSRQVRATDAAEVPSPAPKVSVLVPARNEERGLDACLASLRAQDYPALEIVVLDDRSSDRTAEIIARHAQQDPRVVALSGEEPSPGWLGKPNALRQLAARASGEWLLLTDADTVHAASGVRVGLAYALREGVAALSLAPRTVCETFTAHLLQPQVYAFYVLFIRNLRKRAARGETSPHVAGLTRDGQSFGASGGWMLVRREVWDALGGIESVKDTIAEDFALASRIDDSGRGYRYAAGQTLWRTPAYRSWRDFYEGHARNPVFSTGGSLAKGLVLLVLASLSAVVPFACALLSLLCLLGVLPAELPRWAYLFGVGQYAAVLAMQASLRGVLKVHRWMAVLSPVAGVLGGVLVFRLFLRRRRGDPLAWKGRSYAGH